MRNKRSKRWIGSLVTVLVVGWIGAAASADPIGVVLTPKEFSELFDGTEIPIGDALVTNMSVGNLKAEVVSQAFEDGLGNYAYLYQVINTGTAGNNVIEVFTCNPFFGATSSSTVGYLTAEAPSGFTLDGQLVIGANVDGASGPTVSFGFPAPWPPYIPTSWAIDPGESSVTLYVLSDAEPGTITGNVIDGTIASGDIVGPVPEPVTLAMLAMGGLAVLKGRRHAASRRMRSRR
ncbi:MAG: PEP-CTERM sorting domain-containing protein [Phycisphaerae bacterium]|nr:PEP-CTERM sorting domain-containing protein [Phycisphaerae bacterium]